MRRRPETLLLFASCVFCVVALEVLFYFLEVRQKTYPSVVYHTEKDRVKLMCYDEEFRSSADWDLRGNHPYSMLRYGSNTDNDPTLEGLDPLLVPHAVEIEFNEVGFRERSMQQLVADDSSEVTLFVGDSFGAGQGVRRADRLTERLEQRLNAVPGSDPHLLVNFCMMGYNIGLASQTLEQNLVSFARLRRVVYIFTLNDPMRDQQAHQMSQSINDFMHLRDNLLSETVDGTIIGRSNTGRWVAKRLARRRLSQQTIQWYNYMFSDNTGWRATTARLDQMRDQCRQVDAEFIIVLFPLLLDLDNYPLREAHVALGNYSKAAGIPFIDLLEVFEGSDEEDYWVHPRDFHPNHQAHGEAAGFLFDRIDWQHR